MSYEVDLVVPEGHFVATRDYDAILCSQRYGAPETKLVSVFERNVTFNFQPAIAAAGLASIKDLHGMRGEQAAPVLQRVVTRLLGNRGHGDLIRGGGTWGTYEELVEFLCDFLAACDHNPDAEVRIC